MLALGLLSLLGVSPAAHASLTRACPSYPSGLDHLITFPATVTVPPTLNIGETIVERTETATPRLVGPYCDRAIYSPVTITRAFTRFTGTTSLPNVFATNVPGIGVQILLDGTAMPLTSSNTVSTSDGIGFSFFDGGTITVKFIKTGVINTSGTVAAGGIADHTWDKAVVGRWGVASSIAFVAQVPTCDVAVGSTNITLALNDVRATEFTSSQTSATSASANITLDKCAFNPRVNMTLTGTQAPGLNNVLALTAGTNTAQGIGVQLSATPPGGSAQVLTLGSALALGTATGTTMVIPITARYYRTAGTVAGVTAGTANAKGTLTFNYQ